MSAHLVWAAILGPAAAGLAWAALVAAPPLRRLVGGALGLAAHAAAWAVFWRVFRGEPVGWSGFEPGILGATFVAAGQVAILLVVVRAEALPTRDAIAAVGAIGVAASAIAAAGYSGSLVGLGVLLPLPTLAVGVAALVDDRRSRARGLGGLAAADLAILAGILMTIGREGSTVAAAGGMDPGVAWMLAGAAAKLGAIPGVAAWRVAATEGPAAIASVAIRVQGALIAAIAGLQVARTEEASALAAAAAAAALIAGAGALLAAPGARPSAVSGPAAAVPFLALGLGGAVGARAFLLAALAVPIAQALVLALAWRGPRSAPPAHPGWGAAATVALVGGIVAVAALPPAGLFPGTWLAASLAAARSVPALVLAGAAILGLGLAAIAAVPVARSAHPAPALATVGVLVAGVLIYLGAQPLRLALGVLVRIEEGLSLAPVFASAGAPELPAIGGWDLAWAGAPVVLVVAALAAMSRGLRPVDDPDERPGDPEGTPGERSGDPEGTPDERPGDPEGATDERPSDPDGAPRRPAWVGALGGRVRSALRLGAVLDRAGRVPALGPAIAAVRAAPGLWAAGALEVAAVSVSAAIVARGVALGFL